MTVILSVMVFSNTVQAQESEGYLLKKNQFRIGIGASYLETKDFQFLPIMYHSLRKTVQLGYTNRWNKGIFSTNLNVFLGALTPKSGGLKFYLNETDIYGTEASDQKELEISQMGFNLEIGYLHELSKLKSSRTVLYFGGSLEETLTYTPGVLPLGTMNYASLNAKVRFDYVLANDKPLIFGLTFPVVSLVTRLPYHNAPAVPGKSALGGFFTGNNSVETINHFQNLRFSATYTRNALLCIFYMKVSILIFEDNDELRNSTALLLRSVEGFDVIGSFSNSMEVTETVKSLNPQLILMDIDMPGRNGIEAVKIIRTFNATVPIIMLTVFDSDHYVYDAICAGASGYLLKRHIGEKLITAIHEVLEGGAPMSPSIAKLVVQSMQGSGKSNPDIYQLTLREKEILSSLSKGQ